MAEIWFNLGTVQPSFSEWRFFDNPSVNGGLLRITFTAVDGLPLEKTYSFVRLRRIFPGVSPITVEQSFRVYPQNNPVIIEKPIPGKYADAGLIVAEYQCRFGYRWRDYGKAEPQYLITLEEQ